MQQAQNGHFSEKAIGQEDKQKTLVRPRFSLPSAKLPDTPGSIPSELPTPVESGINLPSFPHPVVGYYNSTIAPLPDLNMQTSKAMPFNPYPLTLPGRLPD